MFVEQLIKKKGECMISGFLEEGGVFLFLAGDTIKELMSYPKCRSVTVINNLARPGSNHREVNCINYN
jgi:hypothetical protein